VVGALSTLEFQQAVTLMDVVMVLQRTEMVLALARLIERYIIELGTEGRLVQLQLGELLFNVREDRTAVLMDYLPDPSPQRVEAVIRALDSLRSEELLSPEAIAEVLGYPRDVDVLETRVSPRGYRMLSRVLRWGDQTIDNIVARFGTLQQVISSPLEELAAVPGVGHARARDIKQGLIRLRELDRLERYG
jgi:diadenylate cyclase